eukprot:TRINITY_DN97908_c0_g1_i1.p1 TRINITY_DN97908_c0_g1~~TRINITY_DN97908_c0_g1_i1.p1  ORF type:complete len:137 (-),score=17.61 TRINITY_DN97908_c0_g1_i1:10-420(-)
MDWKMLAPILEANLEFLSSPIDTSSTSSTSASSTSISTSSLPSQASEEQEEEDEESDDGSVVSEDAAPHGELGEYKCAAKRFTVIHVNFLDSVFIYIRQALRKGVVVIGLALQSTPEIGRAVQQECRDRSRMPSSA